MALGLGVQSNYYNEMQMITPRQYKNLVIRAIKNSNKHVLPVKIIETIKQLPQQRLDSVLIDCLIDLVSVMSDNFLTKVSNGQWS